MKKSHQSACRFKKKPYLCTRLRKMPILRSTYNRDVAQLVSVHVWGACGRQFESGHPDNTCRLQCCHIQTVACKFFIALSSTLAWVCSECDVHYNPQSVIIPPIAILPFYKWLFCSFPLLCAPSCAPLHLAIARYAFDES